MTGLNQMIMLLTAALLRPEGIKDVEVF